jgi:hypothetical protein
MARSSGEFQLAKEWWRLVPLRQCEEELRSTLEDWILVGLKLGHPLPVIAGIDLNKEPNYEPVGSL